MFAVNVFVLGYKDIGEFDRQYLLLAKETGKFQAIGKSVLKPRAKLAGQLEVLNLSWVEIVSSVRGWQITQALEQSSFPQLRKNLNSLRVALRAARVLDDFLPNENSALIETSQSVLLGSLTDQTIEKVFSLWWNFLSYLEVEPEPAAEFIYAQFILKTLALFGLLPEIFSCSECSQRFAGAGALFAQQNLFCFNCARKKLLSGQVMSASALELVKQTLSFGWSKQAEATVVSEISLLANYFLAQAYNVL